MTANSQDLGSPVPGYLGRVLNAGGASAGTCFQVSAGVLVTAWHVLEAIGGATDGAAVRWIRWLAGSLYCGGRAIGPITDLAVLTTCPVQLSATAKNLTATADGAGH